MQLLIIANNFIPRQSPNLSLLLLTLCIVNSVTMHANKFTHSDVIMSCCYHPIARRIVKAFVVSYVCIYVCIRDGWC